jgi:PAS domain S-box-containing protein
MSFKNIEISKFSHSISRRFIIFILIFSSLVTLLGTSLQLYIEYSSDIESIQKTLKQIESSYLQSISVSLWDVNKKQTDMLLDGILRLPDMQRLEIWQNGKLFSSAGKPKHDSVIQSEFKLNYTFKGQDRHLGMLIATANLKTVYSRLWKRTALILCTQAVKTFLVSFFMFFLFYILVGRHLVFISTYTKDLNFELTDTPLKLKRRSQKNNDELEQLVQSINIMRSNLINDIKVREEAGKNLQLSNKRYHSLFQNSPVALWEEDFSELYDYFEELKQKGVTNFREYFDENPFQVKNCAQKVKIFDVNQATLILHDAKTREELLGSLDKIFTEKSFDTFKEEISALAEGQIEFEGEAEVKTLANEVRQISIKLKIDKEQPGSITGLLATLDITESKRTEQAVAQEKERLLVTLRSIGDGVITTDTNGRVTLINKVAEKLTGCPQAEASGKHIKEVFNIINAKTRQQCENPIEKVLVTKTIVELANHTNLISRAGTERMIADSGAPIFDSNSEIIGVVLVFRDVTEKYKIEAQLQQAQKMESIGTLAGGIAHDFNNILGIIVGNTELALDDVPKWNSAHSSLEEIKKASLRAKNIVKQLLSFSRKTDQQLQPIQIGLAIKDALKFLRSTIPTTINIHRDIQTTDETILADPTQINQIIMNLCINAFHAMEQTGGDLTITVTKVILDNNSAKDYPDLKKGDHVKIMVSDTGPGIDPKIIDQIFDPYFTTKEVGKGSGMGLAVVQGIIKSHGGAIAVDSSVGKGTKFIMFFPLSIEKPAVEILTNKDIPRGDETILFVDDEISITKMVKRMFERLGYKVETATTPQEALDRFSLNPDHFDLVITDMTMPQMTGVKLSEKLMDIRKDIPIIVCTGHSTLVDEEKAKDLGLAAYVMKPIDMQETAQTIRNVLDKK